MIRRARALAAVRLGVGLALGFAAALLVSCGSSGKGLIPLASAGPLQSDFEEVARAAETGDGNCTTTEAAIAKTEEDFAALPASVDSGLHNTLAVGIKNLAKHARELCVQPLSGTGTTGTTGTTTTTTPTTTPTTTATSTTTTPTTTPTTVPTTTPAVTPGAGGGTPAGEAPQGGEEGNSDGIGAGGGVGAGGAESK